MPVLREFWMRHPDARTPLIAWHKTLLQSKAGNFAELKLQFGSADRVEGFVVFDIGGNKYRLIADIAFNSQMAFIKHVLTHTEYDKWKPSSTPRPQSPKH
jgi:mRNA interferase HigB